MQSFKKGILFSSPMSALIGYSNFKNMKFYCSCHYSSDFCDIFPYFSSKKLKYSKELLGIILFLKDRGICKINFGEVQTLKKMEWGLPLENSSLLTHLLTAFCEFPWIFLNLLIYILFSWFLFSRLTFFGGAPHPLATPLHTRLLFSV